MPKRQAVKPGDTKPRVLVTFEVEDFKKIEKQARENSRTLPGQVRHMLKPILEEVAA